MICTYIIYILVFISIEYKRVICYLIQIEIMTFQHAKCHCRQIMTGKFVRSNVKCHLDQ